MTTFARRDGCRLPDHAAWEIRKLGRWPEELTLAQLLAPSGTSTGTEAALRVAGSPFVTKLTCLGCGAARPMLRLRRSLTGRERMCGSCRRPMDALGQDLVDSLAAGVLPAGAAGRTLRSLGLEPGEVFGVSRDGQVRFFELAGTTSRLGALWGHIVTDKILAAFLGRQYEDGMALARDSDLLELVPVGPTPVQRYVARFNCSGLRRAPDGTITEARGAEVGIYFPDDYLRRTDPYQILVWLGPSDAWHPNISNCAPVVCLGRLGPGTRLVEILYQLYEVITYQRYATHDALNQDAAAWARQNQDRFPVDGRPLKRRAPQLRIETPAAGGVS